MSCLGKSWVRFLLPLILLFMRAGYSNFFSASALGKRAERGSIIGINEKRVKIIGWDNFFSFTTRLKTQLDEIVAKVQRLENLTAAIATSPTKKGPNVEPALAASTSVAATRKESTLSSDAEQKIKVSFCSQ